MIINLISSSPNNYLYHITFSGSSFLPSNVWHFKRNGFIFRLEEILVCTWGKSFVSVLKIFCLPRTNVLSGPAKRCNMPTVNAQRTPLANFCQIHLHPSSIIFICGNATLGRSASREILEKNLSCVQANRRKVMAEYLWFGNQYWWFYVSVIFKIMSDQHLWTHLISICERVLLIVRWRQIGGKSF